MRIQTTKTEMTRGDLQEVIRVKRIEARRLKKLKEYYSGKQSIQSKQGRENSAVNNRLVNNFAAYISNISTGFFIGKPITYKSKNAGALATLLDIFRYNDEQSLNFDLALESSICGTAFEVLYIDGDSEIRMASIPAEETVLITQADLEEKIIAAIRIYRVYNFNRVSYNDFVDVYYPDKISHFILSGGNLQLLHDSPHFFNDVPIIEYPNNLNRRGDFENVISLIDAYNLAQSLTMDDLSDFTDAFLILKNMHIGDDENAKDLRRRKIIEVEEGGGAEWLIKNLNDTYVENVKKRLQQDIHKFSNVPDMSDENFVGNSSGVALKYKLFGLKQLAANKQRQFKKSLQRRIELISNILKVKSQPPIDFRDIDFQFSENLPTDDSAIVDMVNSLDGFLSRKTLLGLLPFISEPETELEMLLKETEEQ